MKLRKEQNEIYTIRLGKPDYLLIDRDDEPGILDMTASQIERSTMQDLLGCEYLSACAESA